MIKKGENLLGYKKCLNKSNFGGSCGECCGYRENWCCELSKDGVIEDVMELLTGLELKNGDLLENMISICEKQKLKSITTKKALVSGSYDPFTYGHLAIVKEASLMFDEVHVVIFKNAAKKRSYSANDMVEAIKETLRLEGITNCIVSTQDGLLAEYAALNNISYTIRGLRNNMDYNYEENIAIVNKDLNSNLKTVYLRGEDVGISSSTVRELLSYGKDVSRYVPQPILKLIKGE